MEEMGLPFVPVERRSTHYVDDPGSDQHGREYAVWVWGCPKLLPNGRCGDYENRPGLCRSYQPLDDGLCVHFGGAEAGDPSVGLGD